CFEVWAVRFCQPHGKIRLACRPAARHAYRIRLNFAAQSRSAPHLSRLGHVFVTGMSRVSLKKTSSFTRVSPCHCTRPLQGAFPWPSCLTYSHLLAPDLDLAPAPNVLAYFFVLPPLAPCFVGLLLIAETFSLPEGYKVIMLM